MAGQSKVAQILELAKSLSVEELQAAYKGVFAIYESKHLVASVEKAAEIPLNSLVTFVPTKGRNRGIRFYVRVEGFNRAHDAVKGHQCDENGKATQFGPKWTVGVDLVTVVKGK